MTTSPVTVVGSEIEGSVVTSVPERQDAVEKLSRTISAMNPRMLFIACLPMNACVVFLACSLGRHDGQRAAVPGHLYLDHLSRNEGTNLFRILVNSHSHEPSG